MLCKLVFNTPKTYLLPHCSHVPPAAPFLTTASVIIFSVPSKLPLHSACSVLPVQNQSTSLTCPAMYATHLSLSKHFTSISVYSCVTPLASSYQYPLLKTRNRICRCSTRGKVPPLDTCCNAKPPLLDNHTPYAMLSLPRKRRFLHHPQSKPADGTFVEVLLPFLLENKGRP